VGAEAARRRGRGRRRQDPRLLEESLAAAAAAEHSAGGSVAPPDPFTVVLSLTVVPGTRWRVEADPPLAVQLGRAVREAAARRAALRPGRVWCYRCESAACAHAAPPAPDRVFGGWTATGLPRWPLLSELLLEMRSPEVAALFRERGRGTAAAFVAPEALTGSQLEAFGRGSKTYAVLGQTVAGLFPLRPAEDGGEAVPTAITLQAVETRDARGRPRLDLNVLGELPGGEPALESFAGPLLLRVLNVVSVTRRRLRHLGPGPAGASADPARAARAGSILREAARALARLDRQGAGRTRHAAERTLERRPTAKAREDALAAGPEALLRDGRRGTIVVLGPAQRVHVFAPDGRLVTSLALDAEAVRRRMRRERWERLEAAEAAAFRRCVAGGQGESSPTRSST